MAARAGGVGQRVGSGGPYEDRYGYSRVVRVGPLAVTAGCTAVVDGVVQAAGDAGAQARIALGTAVRALEGVGASVKDVVSVRMSIVHAADADAVGLAHREVLGAVRPAATMVVVAGLIDLAMLVEVELTAWVVRRDRRSGVLRRHGWVGSRWVSGAVRPADR